MTELFLIYRLTVENGYLKNINHDASRIPQTTRIDVRPMMGFAIPDARTGKRLANRVARQARRDGRRDPHPVAASRL
ncbi:hypothetical protein [Burkholderia territorii]|uniref:hypothetical protein n=1 Tax=Burkholderia territorii TaxID=1503055 RepID=UPI0012D86EE8|nr:hypothetical protein [Burkholderia territorii]